MNYVDVDKIFPYDDFFVAQNVVSNSWPSKMKKKATQLCVSPSKISVSVKNFNNAKTMPFSVKYVLWKYNEKWAKLKKYKEKTTW